MSLRSFYLRKAKQRAGHGMWCPQEEAMGASGYAYLCGQGHLYHWIDDGLWGEVLEAEVSRARDQVCPCGEIWAYEIPHYGGLNDCICLSEKSEQEGFVRVGEETFRVRILDAAGNPIEAYRDVTLDVYDLSRIEPKELGSYLLLRFRF